MSEKKLNTQQNQNQSRNPQSEHSHACPRPNCDWSECDEDTSCNAYIVQEITVIGDKPSKVCEIVTDTVNERILLIDKRDKLNKLIESFTHPLSDTLLSMVKSDESIKLEDSTKVSNKVEVEKAKPTTKPVSRTTTETKIEQKLDTAPVSKPDTTKPEVKSTKTASKPEAEAKVEQKPKKEAPVQAVKGEMVKSETKDVTSMQTFLPDLSKIQEKSKEAPIKAEESKPKVEAKPLNIVKKPDIMPEPSKLDIDSKPKKDVKDISTKSEPKLETENLKSDEKTKDTMLSSKDGEQKSKIDEKSKEAVTKAVPLPVTSKIDCTSTSVKTDNVEPKPKDKISNAKVDLEVDKNKVEEKSDELHKGASLKSASETEISKSKKQKRSKDKMKKKSNDKLKDLAPELKKTEDKSEVVPPKSDNIKPKDEQKLKDMASEIPILHNLPKMDGKIKTDENKLKVEEKRIETVKSTTKPDAVKPKTEKEESSGKTKDTKPTLKGDDKKPKIDEKPKEEVATMVTPSVIPKSDDKIKGKPHKQIEIKPMPEDKKLMITDTNEKMLGEKPKNVPISTSKTDVIKQKSEENVKDIVPESEKKADDKPEKEASKHILPKSEPPKSEPKISVLPDLPKSSDIATAPATKPEAEKTEKPTIDNKKDKADEKSTEWSVGVPEFWPAVYRAKTATATLQVIQPKAEEKPKEAIAKPDTGKKNYKSGNDCETYHLYLIQRNENC